MQVTVKFPKTFEARVFSKICHDRRGEKSQATITQDESGGRRLAGLFKCLGFVREEVAAPE